MSNDPIGYGDGLNMYAYAYNDPVNFRDPLGLSGNATDENETPDVEEIATEGDRSRIVNSREQSAVGLGLQTGGGGIASAAALGYRMEEEIMVTGTAPDCFSLNSKNSCQTNIFILISAGNPGGAIEEIVVTAPRLGSSSMSGSMRAAFWQLRIALYRSFLDRTFFGAAPEERPYFLNRPDGDVEGSLRRRFGLDSGGVENSDLETISIIPLARGAVWAAGVARAGFSTGFRTLGQNGALLGSHGKGILNRNDYLRFGWTWNGSAKAGWPTLSLRVGNKRAPIHFHINIWPFWK